MTSMWLTLAAITALLVAVSASPSPSPSPSGSATPSPSPSVEYGYACGPCAGFSSGPCQNMAGMCSDTVAPHVCAGDSWLCSCPACETGSGPCHASDGSCHDFVYWQTELCPAGTFACGVASVPVGTPTPTPVPVPCGPCLGTSSGPCQDPATGTCWDTMPFTLEQCPFESAHCTCATCATGSGPCHSNADASVCSPYANALTHECPTNYFECGAPSQIYAGPDQNLPIPPTCTGCAGLSSGPCQDKHSGVCSDFWDADTETCPPWTSQCDCPVCITGAGPCHGAKGKCFPYADHAAQQCPTDTFQCGWPSTADTPPPTDSAPSHNVPLCQPCYGMSSGPCQGDNLVCYPYLLFSTKECAPGSHKCVCPTCTSGAGPCHNIDSGSCTGYAYGNTCPLNHWECGSNGMQVSMTPSHTPTTSVSPSPSPTASPSPSPTASVTPSTSVSPSSTPSTSTTSFLSPTVTTTPSATPSVSASPSVLPACQPCAHYSSGPCQSHATADCAPFTDAVLETCPSGYSTCACPACAGDWAPSATGPVCHHSDGTCSPLSDGGDGSWGCPSNGWVCGGFPSPSPSPTASAAPMCAPCAGGSYGMCQAADTHYCMELPESGMCPVGSRLCAGYVSGGGTSNDDHHDDDTGSGSSESVVYTPVLASPVGHSEDWGCATGTQGPCKSQHNDACYPYYPGTALCPAGTAPCVTSSEMSSYEPWRGQNPDGVNYAGFHVSVESEACQSVVLWVNDAACADVFVTEPLTCLDLTIFVRPCQHQRSQRRRRRLQRGNLRRQAQSQPEEDDETVSTFDVAVEVPSHIATNLPAGLLLELMTRSSGSGVEVHQCESAAFVPATSTVVATGCPAGSYFVGMATSSTLEALAALPSSPKPTPSGTPKPATPTHPTESPSPTPTTSSGPSRAADTDAEGADGLSPLPSSPPPPPSLPSAYDRHKPAFIALGAAAGIGLVMVVGGMMMYRKKSRMSKAAREEEHKEMGAQAQQQPVDPPQPAIKPMNPTTLHVRPMTQESAGPRDTLRSATPLDAERDHQHAWEDDDAVAALFGAGDQEDVEAFAAESLPPSPPPSPASSAEQADVAAFATESLPPPPPLSPLHSTV